MRRLVELQTYAQVNRDYFNGDADEFRTAYVLLEEDLRELYEMATGKRLTNSQAQEIWPNEALEIYRLGRERSRILFERLVDVQAGGRAMPPVIEETMIDMALCIGAKLAEDAEREIDSRNLVEAIHGWAHAFENELHGDLDEDYMTAVEQFTEEKWKEYTQI